MLVGHPSNIPIPRHFLQAVGVMSHGVQHRSLGDKVCPPNSMRLEPFRAPWFTSAALSM